ncbi:reductase [Nesidiocoris tenuis]|uniref:Reductase n=1 Tax=Nesidiocoris tenuis TaxID=355587 RepID=A0ABN7BG93_9HEMI|nr:reductase [Nesidiocoris tenuis]
MIFWEYLWNTSHPPALVEKALDLTLSNLGLEYLDLYLVHWPFAFKEGDALFPMEDGRIAFSDDDYVDTWKAMEKLLLTGKVRSIGISNFNKQQIERVLANSLVVPAINQIECHPFLNQNKLIKLCESKGIKITAYSPLGSPDRPFANPDDPVLLEQPVVVGIAKKHGKTPGQVLIRYQIDRGIIVIPKSVNQERIKSNFDVFNFKLTKEDMDALQGLERGNKAGRYVPFSATAEHKHYPFNDEY